MKTTDTFTYKSEYTEYTDCHFVVNRYGTNGNLALQIYDKEGPVVTCSVNGERKNPDWQIGIKNYSENVGMADFLIEMGIIESESVELESSGFVMIPYYKLTESGKELWAK